MSQQFPCDRVDFYEIAGCRYLGEMTFTPESGNVYICPVEFNMKLGSLIRRPEQKVRYQ